jgi:hypothetical protein
LLSGNDLPLYLVKAPLFKIDDFVKSPTSVLRCILRHCGVPVSKPHSSEFARLEFEAFYFVVRFPTFYGIIKIQAENGQGMHLPSHHLHPERSH